MNTSILQTVKKLLGLDPTQPTIFDPDILVHINSTLSVLKHLGVIQNGILVYDETAQWSDIDSDNLDMAMIQSYVFLKVKLIFDPPSHGGLMEALKKQAEEYEWRLFVIKDPHVPPTPTVPTYPEDPFYY